LYKIGNRTNISNFRPISVLMSFSKIFRKFKYLSLYQQILHDILANNHYGFRHNLLTENTSYKLTDDILLVLNNK